MPPPAQVSRHGALGPARALKLTGPAADAPGNFNLNGIAATPDGKTLIVARTHTQRVYTVDRRTGASAVIEGITVLNVDGIVLQGRRLWIVQNFNNKIARFEFSGDLHRGTLEKEITSPAFGVPTTAAVFGGTLAAVNAHFDTGFPPTYQVVVVKS
ncbi:hypothetical protein [Nonomuraea sp. B19D2]|uniref:hypothetical protein n=1 Tax=Nonomuraea sp. B19D2 TaxID=3159561 RepID=UPI0032DB87BC